MENNIFQPMEGDFSSIKDKLFQSVKEALSFEDGVFYKKNKYRAVREMDFDGQSIFLKQYFNFPSQKSFFQRLGFQKESEAALEWNNIKRVRGWNIPTLNGIAYGELFLEGVEKGGYLLTESLPKSCLRLEDFLREKGNELSQTFSFHLISTLASYVKKMHGYDYFHKDLYLGHFLIDFHSEKDYCLYLIDLQRLKRHPFRKRHFVIKDLAALLFSIPDNTVSRSQQLQFFKCYRGIKKLSSKDKRLIRAISKKGERIARHTKKLLTRRGKVE